VLGRALCRGTAGTGEPDAARSHGAPLGHARRQKTLRPAQAHPRAGVRHHQVGSGLSAILAARARQGPRRVELGDHGLEHQADLRPQYPVKRAGAIAHQPKQDGGTRDHVANLFNPSDPGGRNAKRRSIPRSAKLQSDRLLGARNRRAGRRRQALTGANTAKIAFLAPNPAVFVKKQNTKSKGWRRNSLRSGSTEFFRRSTNFDGPNELRVFASLADAKALLD